MPSRPEGSLCAGNVHQAKCLFTELDSSLCHQNATASSAEVGMGNAYKIDCTLHIADDLHSCLLVCWLESGQASYN